MTRFNAVLLATWLSLVLGCAWLAFHTPIGSDLSLFMPDDEDSTTQLLLDGIREGPMARLILLAVGGGSEQRRAEVSKKFAKDLAETGLFRRVANGSEYLDDQERQWLFAHRYLLSPTVSTERFAPRGLRSSLEQRLRDLASPVPVFDKRWLPEDPTGEFLSVVTSWRLGGQPERRHGVWFSADGARSLLVAETKSPGFDPQAQQRVVNVIESLFAAQGRDLHLRLAGAGVFAADAERVIRFEAQALSLAATALVCMVLLVAYRSMRLLLLSAVPLVSALIVGVAVTGLLFSGIHGITLAFGATLLGMAIDYPLHVFSHLHAGEPASASLSRIWPTIRLGVITTCVAYASLVTTNFPGLTQLGTLAASGLVTAALCTRWVLPVLLPLNWAPRFDARRTKFLNVLLNPGRALTTVAAVVGIVALLGLLTNEKAVWEDDLAALSPVSNELRVLDAELRAELGAPEVSHAIVVMAPDTETALQRGEELEPFLDSLLQEGMISGFDIASRYLPSKRTQQRRQMDLPPAETLADDLAAASLGLPFKKGLFLPFEEAVEAARMQPLVDLDDIVGSALGVRAESLLFSRGNESLALIPLAGVADKDLLAARIARQKLGAAVHYVDLKGESDRLVEGFREEALTRLAWGGVLILMVLCIDLRRVRRVVAVVAPVLLAMLVTVSALIWFGEQLSLFHLIALLLVLGIGVDYSLFFSRGDRESGMRQGTCHAVVVCAISTAAVFGILAVSTIPVLQAIGRTVALGVAASFLMALVMAQRFARM